MLSKFVHFGKEVTYTDDFATGKVKYNTPLNYVMRFRCVFSKCTPPTTNAFERWQFSIPHMLAYHFVSDIVMFCFSCQWWIGTLKCSMVTPLNHSK